ncbi:MAG TPA: hypothetical protein VF783_22200, partial [Terriglobales bacterium]
LSIGRYTADIVMKSDERKAFVNSGRLIITNSRLTPVTWHGVFVGMVVGIGLVADHPTPIAAGTISVACKGSVNKGRVNFPRQ